MIRIGILGDIGSGKSYVAKSFGYPVFNADNEVGKLYKNDRKIFNKLKKALPKYINSFPINKNEISNAILSNKSSLEKIVKIVHLEIRKKLDIFLNKNKNKNKKIVILDIPLLLENKINAKNDILVFVKSKKTDILKRLKRRVGFNPKLLNKFKNIQLPLDYKKKKSQFVIKNNFTKKPVNKSIKKILKDIF
jgi:dephospho-CoA kinase